MQDHAYRSIAVEPVSPTIGATVGGVDLNLCDSPTVYEEIRVALWAHQVLFFRHQALSLVAYSRLAAHLGPAIVRPAVPHVAEYPQIQVVARKQNPKGPEADNWHSDLSYRPAPPLISILRPVRLPRVGGDTLFASAVAAYAALPDPLQSMLRELSAIHDLPLVSRRSREAASRDSPHQENALDDLNAASELSHLDAEHPAVIHPVVVTHPYTKRATLFVNSLWTTRLVAVDFDLGHDLLRLLFRWLSRPEFSTRFSWDLGSLVICDNFAAQHFAVFDYDPGSREMQRILCAPTVPISAAP
jgi:taurine dioxygenase